eukprot:1760771-Rhodomonas_salina.7
MLAHPKASENPDASDLDPSSSPPSSARRSPCTAAPLRGLRTAAPAQRSKSHRAHSGRHWHTARSALPSDSDSEPPPPVLPTPDKSSLGAPLSPACPLLILMSPLAAVCD